MCRSQQTHRPMLVWLCKITTDKPGGQTRGDVNKHVGTMMKRRKGREQALKKLTK